MRAACNPVWDLSSTHVPFCFVHHDDKCFPPPRPLSSAQDGIYVLGKAHMRSTPSVRGFPNVAFETAPMFVWLTMALSRPFKEERLALPLSTPLSSRRSMVWCPWLGARR